MRESWGWADTWWTFVVGGIVAGIGSAFVVAAWTWALAGPAAMRCTP